MAIIQFSGISNSVQQYMVSYPTSHTQNEHYVGLLWKWKIFVFPIDQAVLTVCFNWK
jgi:hypothetical protein